MSSNQDTVTSPPAHTFRPISQDPSPIAAAEAESTNAPFYDPNTAVGVTHRLKQIAAQFDRREEALLKREVEVAKREVEVTKREEALDDDASWIEEWKQSHEEESEEELVDRMTNASRTSSMIVNTGAYVNMGDKSALASAFAEAQASIAREANTTETEPAIKKDAEGEYPGSVWLALAKRANATPVSSLPSPHGEHTGFPSETTGAQSDGFEAVVEKDKETEFTGSTWAALAKQANAISAPSMPSIMSEESED